MKILVKTQRDISVCCYCSPFCDFTSIEHSNKPSFVGTSTINDDGSRGEGKKIELFVETCYS